MDNKLLCKNLRREFSISGYALLIHYALMNVCVFVVAVIQTVILLLQWDTLEISDTLIEELMTYIISSGWGYILACAIACVLILVWKKKEFCFQTIWLNRRPMRPGTFLALLCLAVSCQAIFQVITFFAELILNQFGLSVMDSVESASGISNTFSMVLYGGFVAPVFEEIAFRGVILRGSCHHGKRFAILSSAFLFGMFHGNIVQSPYAFLMGLILGYITVEYSIVWAILLHFINNFVLGYLMELLISPLSYFTQELIFVALIWGCTIVSVVIVLVKRKQIVTYFRENPYPPMRRKAFFTCGGVILFTVILFLNMFLMLMA